MHHHLSFFACSFIITVILVRLAIWFFSFYLAVMDMKWKPILKHRTLCATFQLQLLLTQVADMDFSHFKWEDRDSILKLWCVSSWVDRTTDLLVHLSGSLLPEHFMWAPWIHFDSLAASKSSENSNGLHICHNFFESRRYDPRMHWTALPRLHWTALDLFSMSFPIYFLKHIHLSVST